MIIITPGHAVARRASERLIRSQSRQTLSRDQARLAKASDQRVEQAQVCTTPSRKLRTDDGCGDRASPCLTLASRNESRREHSGEPRHVDIGEGLHFSLHRVRKIVILSGHEAAEAHPIIRLQRLAEKLWIGLERFDRIAGRGDRFKVLRRVFPVVLRYRCTQIGLAGKVRRE
jgi:hypothetical protein